MMLWGGLKITDLPGGQITDPSLNANLDYRSVKTHLRGPVPLDPPVRPLT